jgi:hypothetical protein
MFEQSQRVAGNDADQGVPHEPARGNDFHKCDPLVPSPELGSPNSAMLLPLAYDYSSATL